MSSYVPPSSTKTSKQTRHSSGEADEPSTSRRNRTNREPIEEGYMYYINHDFDRSSVRSMDISHAILTELNTPNTLSQRPQTASTPPVKEETVRLKSPTNLKSVMEEKPHYPEAVYFIYIYMMLFGISKGFFLSTLILFLRDQLLFTETSALLIYHSFSVVSNLSPIVGALICDNLMGKFKTILISTTFGICSHTFFLLASFKHVDFFHRFFMGMGLLFRIVNIGGVNPCVIPFGADQFQIPNHIKFLKIYWEIMFWTDDLSYLFARIVAPCIRMDTHCFGDVQCYPLVYSVPLVCYCAALGIFIMGSFYYVKRKPHGNKLVEVGKCIHYAFSQKMKSLINGTGEFQYHWMDFAEHKYGPILIEDIKIIFRIYVLFLPLCFYWSLYYQPNTRFTLQASYLDGEVYGYLLKPEHIQVLSPILCFLFIPLFKMWLYPSMRACNLGKPLQKITIGGILASVGFIMAGILEYRIRLNDPVLPKQGSSQIRIYNGMHCDFLVKSNISGEETFFLHTKKVLTTTIKVTEKATYYLNIKSLNGNCEEFVQYITAYEAEERSYFIVSPTIVQVFEDHSDRSHDGFPKVSVLGNLETAKDIIFQHTTRLVARSVFQLRDKEYQTLYPGTYNIQIGGQVIAQEKFKMGGVCTFVITETDKVYKMQRNKLVDEFSLHMMWMIPQFIFLAAGEVMVCVTGLQFSYYEAPYNMRGIVFSFWLFGKAMGNLIIVFIVAGDIGEVNTYFVFGTLALTAMIMFGVLALNYRSEWDY